MAKNIVIKNVAGANLITVSSLSFGVDTIASISGGREILQRPIVGNNIQVSTNGTQVILSANPIPTFTITNLGSGLPVGIGVSGNRDFNFRTIGSRNNTVNIELTANTVDLNVNSLATSHLVYYRFSRSGASIGNAWLLVDSQVDASRTFTIIPYDGYYVGSTFAHFNNSASSLLNIMILKNNSLNVADARLLRQITVTEARMYTEMLPITSAIPVSAGDAISVYHTAVAGTIGSPAFTAYFLLKDITNFVRRKNLVGTSLPTSGPSL